MRKSFFICVISLSMLASAQQSKVSQCEVSPDRREEVVRYLNRALDAAKQIKSDYTQERAFGGIAAAYVCMGMFAPAAKLSEEAYPSGSEAQSELGRAVANAGRLAEVPALEAQMKHGAHSFLYGLVEALSEKGDLDAAQTWAAKIEPREVRDDAEARIAIAMYKVGHTEEALRRVNLAAEKNPASKKETESPAEVEFGLAMEAQDWKAAHRIWDKLPDGVEKRYGGALLAVHEAEGGADGAEKDLLDAAHRFDGNSDPPYEGYLIAAHLAGLKDYAAATQVAEAVRDDEWNRKCWTTIASFQAEDGKLAEAQASIARIGSGKLVHALGDEAGGRDDAREFVASGLAAAGKGDAALALLDAHESKEDFKLHYLVGPRVEALAANGEFQRARAIVDKELGDSTVADERDQNMAAGLASAWHDKDSAAAEQWIGSLKLPEVRAACWMEVAGRAMGFKPEVPHYFMNWD